MDLLVTANKNGHLITQKCLNVNSLRVFHDRNTVVNIFNTGSPDSQETSSTYQTHCYFYSEEHFLNFK